MDLKVDLIVCRRDFLGSEISRGFRWTHGIQVDISRFKWIRRT